MIILRFTIITFFATILVGKETMQSNKLLPTRQLYKTTNYDQVPDPVLSWVGAGFFTQYTISNTGQSGVFEPPPGWNGYNGEFPIGYGAYNGRTGEFPNGTNQFYTWGAGLWIGGKSEYFNTPEDRSITIGNKTIENVRVATTAYYSEMSSISKLWQSNQLISAVSDGKLEENKGEYLFGQKNKTVEEYQDIWAYFEPQPGDYHNPASDTIFRLDFENVNKRRNKFLATSSLGLDSSLLLLDPFREDENGNIRGDIISDEDTYCVFGDYLNERDGKFLWNRGYDTRGLGIKVEQQTYSWATDDYLYINYKITNMNDFPLDSIYVGYFMDNDVGYADDDLIGFDRSLNLGYSYDSDSEESGWIAPAGYLGSVFVETPVDSIGDPSKGVPPAGNQLNNWQIGLTGFQTWIRSDLGQSEGHPGDVDDDEMDHIKYFQLSMVDSFEVFEEPQDVRQLATSGPVIRLDPGNSIIVTVALVAGSSLSDLKKNTQSAIDKFNSGYIGAEAPPSPKLSVQPAHKAVYLSWDNFPETVIDPFTGLADFAGYRVYRSLSGLQNDWTLLADYDVAGDSSEWSGIVEYSKGTSNAISKFIGPLGSGDISANPSIDAIEDRFIEAEYTIELMDHQIEIDGITLDTMKMMIYNVSNLQSVLPNIAAMTTGEGFRTYAEYDSTAMKAGNGTLSDIELYRNGYFIYLDGFFVQISNGEYIDLDLDGIISDIEIAQQSLKPRVGDIFIIKTYAAEEIGGQSGLSYTYLDDGLIDGMNYFYSVVSYDRGVPIADIPQLESSLYQNIILVRPQHMALELAGEPKISDYIHSGPSTGQFLKAITSYENLTGHQYGIQFFQNDASSSENETANYGILIDSTLGGVGVVEPLKSIIPGESYTDTLTIAGNGFDEHGNPLPPMGVIMPGTFNLTIDNNILSDQINGILKGVINGDTIVAVINYGDGTIHLTADMTAGLTGASPSAQYSYNPLILESINTSSFTGNLNPETVYGVASTSIVNDQIITQDHGFIFMVTNPALSIDSVYWSLGTNVSDVFKFDLRSSSLDPYDYYITFYDQSDSSVADTSAIGHFRYRNGDDSFLSQRTPISIYNMTLGKNVWSYNIRRAQEKYYLWWILDEDEGANTKNSFRVLTKEAQDDVALNPTSFEVTFLPFDENIVGGDALAYPDGANAETPDTLFMTTSRPLTVNDEFRFYTVNMLDTLSHASLDEVKVVPNPYIVRALWDQNRFTQHIDFRHLPASCSIRIFNVAGEWIATLVKDGIVGNNEVYDEEGSLSWDLRNYEGLKVASGLYLYQLKGELLGKTVYKEGKIAIVLGP